MKTIERIYEMVANATEPVTLKMLQDQLELKPGIVSGSLATLCRAGRLSREKVEKTNGNGPKLQWAYSCKKETVVLK
jgi:hypothetical protein